jgi:hypothetical protein
MAIGVSYQRAFVTRANAQEARPSPANQQPQYEEVSPGVTTGTIAVHTLLAHRIAADQIMVNGYDLMALHEGIINLLKNKGIAKYQELDALIERAKIPRPLRMKSPEQASPPKPEEPKK